MGRTKRTGDMMGRLKNTEADKLVEQKAAEEKKEQS
jgi:hypothetical protein